MAFKDDYDFDLLVNEAENLIIEEIENQLEFEENNKMCKCQECILDIATFALNKTKPTYRSSFTGVLYAQQFHSGDYQDEVVKSVKAAIEKIKKNPSHNL